MKNALFAAVLSAAALACLPARAQEDSLESGVFAPWLTSIRPNASQSPILARFPK